MRPGGGSITTSAASALDVLHMCCAACAVELQSCGRTVAEPCCDELKCLVRQQDAGPQLVCLSARLAALLRMVAVLASLAWHATPQCPTCRLSAKPLSAVAGDVLAYGVSVLLAGARCDVTRDAQRELLAAPALTRAAGLQSAAVRETAVRTTATAAKALSARTSVARQVRPAIWCVQVAMRPACSPDTSVGPAVCCLYLQNNCQCALIA